MSFVRATFDYDATEAQELTMVEGDLIEVIQEDESGWWTGRLNGKEGLFPSNFCEPAEEGAGAGVGGVEEDDYYEEEAVEDESRDVPPMQAGRLAVSALPGMDNNELMAAIGGKRKNQGGGMAALLQKDNARSNAGGRRASPASMGKAAGSRAARQPKVDTSNLVVAKHDYIGAPEDDELSFSGNDMITVLKRDDSGWWQGELNGEVGWFPHTFVRTLNAEEERALAGPEEEPPATTTKSPVVARNPRGPGPGRNVMKKRGPKRKGPGPGRAPPANKGGGGGGGGASAKELEDAKRQAAEAEALVTQLREEVEELRAELANQKAESAATLSGVRSKLQAILSSL